MKKSILLVVCMAMASVSWAGEVKDAVAEVKEVAQEIAPVADRVSDKLAQYMTAAEKVISQYGGEAVELGLTVLRIEAGTGLVYGFGSLLVSFMFLKMMVYGSRAQSSEWREKHAAYHRIYDADAELPMMIFGGAFSVIGFAIGVFYLLDLWAWVGVFYPEAYAVHKFLM